MLLELAACGLPAPQGGEAPDVSMPEDVAATVEPTPEPYVVPGNLTLAINEVMPSNKATLAVDGAFPHWADEEHRQRGDGLQRLDCASRRTRSTITSAICSPECRKKTDKNRTSYQGVLFLCPACHRTGLFLLTK